MHRRLLAVLLAFGLVAALAGAASAATWPVEWPPWNEVTGTFPCTVSSVQTSTGWDYTVNIDPAHAYPGWGIQAFAVYADSITTQESNGWGAYDGGKPAAWTYDGGWKVDKYPGLAGTTAAFGWVTWTGAFVYSGSSASFHAINLPDGFANWGQHFGVLVKPPDTGITALCDNSFWAPAEGGGPPQETPEPGSLVLLTLGAGAMLGGLKRRKPS